MRIAGVAHVLGFLLMFLGIAMLLPIPFSLYFGERDYIALAMSAGIALIAGYALFITTSLNRELRAKEGFAIVAFGWLTFSAFGALPYLFSGAIPAVEDAFFETMSGFTTTGATILSDVESLSHGLLFWRSLTHWIGGMGIIVLSLAILPLLGVGGMQLFKAEMPGAAGEKLTPRITETAKILWAVYLILTTAETGLLMLGGMPLFDALCHAFGTVATGGFSTKNASIGAYNSAYIDYVVIVFMVLAGANFSLHYRFLRGEFRVHILNKEFLFFLSIIALASLIIGVDTYAKSHGSAVSVVQKTLFQVVSILTTTGYGTADYEAWDFSSQFIIFMLMFFGGCTGSTGGGIKIIRIFVLGKLVFSEITRLLHPHAVVTVRIGERVVPREVVLNVVGFFVLFMLTFVLGVMTMSTFGLDMATSFGSVAATLANVGPGFGDVGPTGNYSQIPPAGKWVLSLLMLMGRLEIFTIIVLLSPMYWQK